MTSRRRLALLLILGGLARGAWSALVPVDPVSDSAAYFTFATNLAKHGVFGWRADAPDAYWPPGAPALYALAFGLVGAGGSAVVLVNTLLFGAKLALLSWLAGRWYGERAAWVAGLVVALSPTQIVITTALTSEMAFDASLLAGVAWFERHWRTPSVASGAGLGLLIAATSFVRPTALPLAVALGALALFRGAPIARTLLSTAVALGVMSAAIAPWSMRNHALFGRWVVISANGGANLWMGNNPDSSGRYMALPPAATRMDAAARDAWLGAEAKRWMLEHPGSALELAARKLAITHATETIGVVWNERGLRAAGAAGAIPALKALANVSWWALLLLGIAGFAQRMRATASRALLTEVALPIWVYFAMVHAVTVAQDRYHLPSVPFIAALAGAAVATRGTARAKPPHG